MLKCYGFEWGDWVKKSMRLPNLDFELEFIIKEFTGGTYELSQVSLNVGYGY